MNFLQILSLGLIFLSEVHGLCKFTDDKGPQKRARCIYPFKFNQVTISSTFYARVFFYKIFDAKISNPKASFVVFGWCQILYKKCWWNWQQVTISSTLRSLFLYESVFDALLSLIWLCNFLVHKFWHKCCS